MSKLNVIKDKLQFQRLVEEKKTEIIKREEYLIPDTQQDVDKILSVEAMPVITSKEILSDKIVVEGYIKYNILYVPRDNEVILNSVHYTEKFTENIMIDESEHKIKCDVECKMEHIEARVMNERKIEIQGNVNIDWIIYKKIEVEYVKDIETTEENVQMLKEEEIINKIVLDNEYDIENNTEIRIGMDKPAIGKILAIDTKLYKKEIRASDGKISLSSYCRVKFIYFSSDFKEISEIESDIYISKDQELMIESLEKLNFQVEFKVNSIEAKLKEDDLGETRIINLNLVVKAKVKIYASDNIELIKDVYSTKYLVTISKSEYEIGVVKKLSDKEVIIKNNIDNEDNNFKLIKVENITGRILSLNQVESDGIVTIDGMIEIGIVCSTNSDEIKYTAINGQIPYEFNMEIPNNENEFKLIIKCDIEDIEAVVEGNSVAIKIALTSTGNANYLEKKVFIEDVIEEEEEVEKINSSVIIYVIEEGDTLWKLAKKYKTTISDIVKLNDIQDPDYIVAGEKLIIPGRAIF